MRQDVSLERKDTDKMKREKIMRQKGVKTVNDKNES